MRAQLVPLDSASPPIEITKDMTLVGRGEVCDIRLEHKSISKLHCVIVRTDGLLLLRDLGSTNGTRVNGQRVRRAALLPDDQVSVANLKFRVLFGEKLLKAYPEEKTQQIDAGELQRLLNRALDSDSSDEDGEDDSSLAIQANPLPDVYPEDDSSDPPPPARKP